MIELVLRVVPAGRLVDVLQMLTTGTQCFPDVAVPSGGRHHPPASTAPINPLIWGSDGLRGGMEEQDQSSRPLPQRLTRSLSRNDGTTVYTSALAFI